MRVRVGDKLICIDNSIGQITIGNVYVVADHSTLGFEIENDDNGSSKYFDYSTVNGYDKKSKKIYFNNLREWNLKILNEDW